MTEADRAARQGALAVLESERGTLRVVGPDRKSWLNGLITCDVAAVEPGSGRLGLVLTKTGKILSDLYVISDESALYLGCSAARSELVPYLDRMLVMEDAELADVSDERSWVVLHGPSAKALAQKLADKHRAAHGEIDLTGLGGAALSVPRASLDALLSDLRATQDVTVGDANDWERLRLERGHPTFGVDYGPDDNPHQASLDQRAVSWTKGCYLGQEVVCMQGMRGKVKRRVVPIVLDGGALPERGARVVDEASKEVGEVTSAALSEVVGRPIALARVTGPLAHDGGAVRIDDASARIVERPDAA